MHVRGYVLQYIAHSKGEDATINPGLEYTKRIYTGFLPVLDYY